MNHLVVKRTKERHHPQQLITYSLDQRQSNPTTIFPLTRNGGYTANHDTASTLRIGTSSYNALRSHLSNSQTPKVSLVFFPWMPDASFTNSSMRGLIGCPDGMP
ncbi:hypothetical protein FRC02_006454 [Tulasnella sp. 418]|nr:hypothetical protein FRC02_006454 [Tulasnella sp. 418]